MTARGHHYRRAAFRRRQNDRDARRARCAGPARLAVRAAKAGPDYIDPAFHAAALGTSSVNLDSWAMPGPLLDALGGASRRRRGHFCHRRRHGPIRWRGRHRLARRGATADLAAHFGFRSCWCSMSRGRRSRRRPWSGVLPRMIRRLRSPASSSIASASEKHRKLVADAIAALGIGVFGALPRDAAIALPERHLGLVQAGEHADLAALIDRLAAMAERHLDLDALLAKARPLRAVTANRAVNALPPPGQRVALACDRAFTFAYPHLIEAWRRAGAEIIPFSPLADQSRRRAGGLLLVTRRLSRTPRRCARRG